MKEIGKRVGGATAIIPHSMLKTLEPVHGSIYELHIKTKSVPNPEQAIHILTTELPKKFPDLKILWIRVQDSNIRLQISPNTPFAWAALLLFLPTLLGAIGIIIVLVAVFLLFAAVPSWVIALFVIGLTFVVFGPKIGEWALAGIPTI